MAKAKVTAKKAPKLKGGLLRSTVKVAAKIASSVVGKKSPGKKPIPTEAKSPAKKGRPVVVAVKETPVKKSRPRATKLPPLGAALNRREMEQVLTPGEGRGVVGEGSLKGKLTVKDDLPHLQVVGRDKRELVFLLQGPEQEVLSAYVDHKVSVSGLIHKTHNHGGVVDVRKYAAKKPEVESVEPQPTEVKLRYLSPGDLEQISNPGMGAGMRGFGHLRGNLEMTGEEFFLVVSGAGTRQQVSFILEGKSAKGLKKNLGQTLHVTGVIDKATGWGGRITVDSVEVRASELRGISRDNLEMTAVEDLSKSDKKTEVQVKLNQGLTVRLPERAGFTWAIEPTMAKRMGLREANFEPSATGPGTREFFFTPRNPGSFDVEFFLAKALAPSQVAKSATLLVHVLPSVVL